MVETRRSKRLRSRSADAAESPSANQEKQQPRPTRTSPRRSAGRKQRSYSETNLERSRKKNHQDDEDKSYTKLTGISNSSTTTTSSSKNPPATAAQQEEKNTPEVATTKKQESEISDQQREDDTKVAEKRLSSMDDAHVDKDKGRLDDDGSRSSEKEGEAIDAKANPNEEKRAQKTKPATISSKPRVDPTRNIKVNNKTSVSGKTNALTKLIPGYTAPPTLTSDSLMAKYRPAGGLEGLRRAALRSDPRTAKAMDASKKALQQPGGGAAVAFGSSSFKMGHNKRQRQPPGRAGDGWFGMRPTPMTEDVKKDLHLIRNRNYLDPKRFYKNPDLSGKLVQVGTVIEGPTEYYSSRLTKKQRRTNLVDEILADPSTASYAQNKYKEIQREKTALAMKRKKGRRGKR